MRYLSVCSGIEAASVAWRPLGWQAVAFSEIDPFACSVLRHRFPDVPNWGDLERFKEWPDADIDLLCGGTPCQAFSVAGLRRGLDDPRGNITLTYLALAAKYRPRWLVWENVPGVLSIDAGRVFGAFLGGLAELGYGFAYRVLDAQHFGVPQRRRRVFVVGCLGDWRRAAAVLFERHSLQGHPPPRRETGQSLAGTATAGAGGSDENDARDGRLITGTVTARSSGGGGLGTDFDCDGGLTVAVQEDNQNGVKLSDVTGSLRADAPGSQPCGSLLLTQAFSSHGHGEFREGLGMVTARTGRDGLDAGLVTHSLRGEGFDASEDGTGRGTPLVPVAFNLRGREDGAQPEMDPSGLASLRAASGGSSRSYLAFAENSRAEVRLEGGDGQRTGALSTGGGKAGQGVPCVAFQSSQSGVREVETHATLDANNGSRRHNGVSIGGAVRRLLPIEAERLQGFPDDWTLVPYRGKPAADGPRYKAIGNSWAVPVARWIGERIEAVERIAGGGVE